MAQEIGVDPFVWLHHAWRNRIHSLVLLFVMAGFLALLGWLLWGRDGLFALVAVGLVAILFNPVFSPWLVMRMYGARPVHYREAPELWKVLSQLAESAGLQSRPQLFYVSSRMLNAFAVGSRQQSAIAVTDGLLRPSWLHLPSALAGSGSPRLLRTGRRVRPAFLGGLDCGTPSSPH